MSQWGKSFRNTVKQNLGVRGSSVSLFVAPCASDGFSFIRSGRVMMCPK